MTALEKIFQGYYEERLGGDEPDPEDMQAAQIKILEEMEEQKVEDSVSIMEAVSEYGIAAEKSGFMAGFRMAWELLRNMQENV
ncbi:MAG: hypothetical protein Q4C77_03030 [Eubacteriales bacterium]|nr:hypothetical protein [Eubacteriales bacterium]